MGTTEIRVHGVADRGPEDILDRPIVVRVAGDQDAGFYRPRPGFGSPVGVNGVMLEAYQWSRLTGGRASRVLLLVLLLPFMLANITVWMLPVAGRDGAVGRAVCRLLAATLTAMYVLSIVGVSLDLIAWQCAGNPRCLQGRRALSWLTEVPTGARLALFAVAPIMGVALLWRLGARTWQLPEDATSSAQGVGADRLDTPAFWDTRALLRRLRSLHVAVALGTLNASLLIPLVGQDRSPPGYALLAADAIVLAAALAALSRRKIEQRGGDPRTENGIRALRWTSVALTGTTLAYALAPRPSWRPGGTLPGGEEMLASLFVGQVILVVVLSVGAAVQRLRCRPAAMVVGGLGAPVLATLAIGMALAFAAAPNFMLADYLDRGLSPTLARPRPSDVPPLWPPGAGRWAILGFSLALLSVALLSAVRTRIGRTRRRQAADELVRQEFPEASHVPPERVRAVRDAIVRSWMADRLGTALPLMYTALALFTLGAAGLSPHFGGPGQLALTLVGPELSGPVVFVTDVGTLLTVAFVVVLAGGSLVASRSGGVRLLGVLWELATFWPRAAHPLAPPCYSERAVPELARRIRTLTADGDAVVLSGQSHGSVLAAATVLQLPPACRRRVALLTYVTPLNRLYARVFPAYVNEQMLHEIGERIGWRWISLWRYTDPIGGPVFPTPAPGQPAGRVDRRVRDPKGLRIPPTDTVPPPLRRHRYEPDDDLDAAVADLATRLRSPA